MKLNNQIIYQIYPKSFCDLSGDGIGDLKGIISKLDYLKDLGGLFMVIPINVSPQKDNGYDIADYYHIDSIFGRDEDYFELIEEAKKRDIKIMMDLVLNHVSTEHIWFKKALSGDPYYHDFFIWKEQPTDLTSLFGGSAWEWCEEVGAYYLHLFDIHQADLNFENENVRKSLYEMINYWIEKGVQGFRLDVIDLIGKNIETGELSRTPKFFEYLHELQANTFKQDLLTVGECWGADLKSAKEMCDGAGLTQVFHFNHLTTTHGKDKWHQSKLSLSKLAKVIEKWQNEYDGIEALVMNNHDMPRLISLWLDDEDYRKQSAELLIMLFGLLKGNLYIYQGEEFGMRNAYFDVIEDYEDIESLNAYFEMIEKGESEEEALARLQLVSRDNARIPLLFNDEEGHGFSKTTPWIQFGKKGKSLLDADSQAILAMYKAIIKFRKSHEDCLEHKISFTVSENVLYFTKANYVGIFNFGKQAVELLVEGEVLFHNYPDKCLKLRAYEAYIILKEE